jgi:hypothetical protein
MMKDYEVECIICFGESLGNKLRGKRGGEMQIRAGEREKKEYYLTSLSPQVTHSVGANPTRGKTKAQGVTL